MICIMMGATSGDWMRQLDGSHVPSRDTPAGLGWPFSQYRETANCSAGRGRDSQADMR